VDTFAVNGVRGFHPDFAERRMRVNRAAQFGRGQLGANGGGGTKSFDDSDSRKFGSKNVDMRQVQVQFSGPGSN